MSKQKLCLVAIIGFLWIVMLFANAEISRQEVTIGTYSILAPEPLCLNSSSSLTEYILLDSEIGVTGTITAISFQYDFPINVPAEAIQIFIGTTAWNDMSQGWIPAGSLNSVFSGVMNYPMGANRVTYAFSTPFEYNGGNLAVMVHRPLSMQIYTLANRVYTHQWPSTNRLRRVNTAVDFDPYNPPNAGFPQLNTNFPVTTLHFASQSPQAEFLAQPSIVDFGDKRINTMQNIQLRIFNTGQADLEIVSAGIDGDQSFTLLEAPDFPIILSPGASFMSYAHWEPQIAGLHQATLNFLTNTTTGLHTVPLSGYAVDPVIYTLPYFQDFDQVLSPALPIDWDSYIEPYSTGNSVWCNDDANAPSPPNVARMMYNNPTSTALYLIAPPLADGIAINNIEMEFMVHTFGSVIYTGFFVGIMEDPDDPFSFYPIQYYDWNQSGWRSVITQFHYYQGNGRYIAFKHSMLSYGSGIKIDIVQFRYLNTTDLAVTELLAPGFANAGQVKEFRVKVANLGLQTQDNYTVKLLADNGTLLASTSGIPIAHAGDQVLSLYWTPLQMGTFGVYAMVEVANDIVTQNNCSDVQTLVVLPHTWAAITIGTNELTARKPVDLYRNTSLYQCLIPSSEIEAGVVINGVQLYTGIVSANLSSSYIQMWLGSSTEDNLLSGWVPSSALNLVFSGLVSFDATYNITKLIFPNPYTHPGGNLLMMFYRPRQTQIYSSSDMFECFTLGENSTRMYVSDTDTIDPANPPMSTFAQLGNQVPKISFYTMASSIDSEMLPAPSNHIFAGPNPFSTETKVFIDLKTTASVEVTVYNLRGQKIKELYSGIKYAGKHEVQWDGMDNAAKPCPKGIYFLRVKTGADIKHLKLLRI